MDKARAARLAALKDTRGWDDLVEELEAADARSWQKLTADLRGGADVDPLVVAGLRATSLAIKLILRQPERAARVLARESQEEEPE